MNSRAPIVEVDDVQMGDPKDLLGPSLAQTTANGRGSGADEGIQDAGCAEDGEGARAREDGAGACEPSSLKGGNTCSSGNHNTTGKHRATVGVKGKATRGRATDSSDSDESDSDVKPKQGPQPRRSRDKGAAAVELEKKQDSRKERTKFLVSQGLTY